MTSGPALPCPKCQRVLQPASWINESGGACEACHTEFTFLGFPALNASATRVQRKDALLAEHATCFYHTENQAEVVCDGCGRFLCPVCAIDFSGRKLCPACMSAARTTDAKVVNSRTLYDGIALAVAVLPVFIWPITVVTAPAALGVVIFGWRRPRSLVTRGRSKLIIAGTVAILQLAAWGTFFGWRWLK